MTMKTKEQSAPTEGSEVKEHKKNWREVYATTEDIQNFLCANILLRQNEVTGCPEFRVPMRDEFDALGMMYPTGTVPLMEWQSATEWHRVDDRLVNSLHNMLSASKEVKEGCIRRVINSDFVPRYNPFRFYLSRLPPWDGKTNYIMELSLSVNVAGGAEEQMFFYYCLRKWLVGMVAGWLDDEAVNHEILVFVGRQGIYKTTWFNNLLPPELQVYFNSNTSFGSISKDEVLKLSQYGLICCEELDTMRPSEMNRLKWAVTTTVTDERAPYAHYSERRKHIASYCGTGNNLQFIDDDTGTRRWLPFEVESITSPRHHPFNYAGIFSQAYALFKKGFHYWFNEKESELLARHNERFEVAQPERELISKYYRPPRNDERGEFVSSTDIMQAVGGGLIPQLTRNKLGRAMTALGFERKRSHGQWGYNVVAYTAEEIKGNRSVLAYDAQPAPPMDVDAIFEADAEFAELS